MVCQISQAKTPVWTFSTKRKTRLLISVALKLKEKSVVLFFSSILCILVTICISVNTHNTKIRLMIFKVYTSWTSLVYQITTSRQYGRSLIPWPNNTLPAASSNLTHSADLLSCPKHMNTGTKRSPAQNTYKSYSACQWMQHSSEVCTLKKYLPL